MSMKSSKSFWWGNAPFNDKFSIPKRDNANKIILQKNDRLSWMVVSENKRFHKQAVGLNNFD